MRRTSASVLLVVLLAGAASRAQESEPAVQETAEAVLVEVPVRVTDRHGNPIRGLEAKDFEVYDDGKKQEILAVDAIDLARKSLAPGDPAPIHPAARRHFLLLFDFSFARPKSILGAQLAARDFIMNGVAETDLVAVATYSVEFGLKLLVTFSGDRVQAARAVESLGLLPTEDLSKDPLAFAFDIAKVSPVSSAIGMKEANAAAITETLQTMMQIARARVDEYARQRVHRLTESLKDLASTLDSVSGRKDVVYLSEGFQSRLVTGTKDTEQERDWILSGEYWKIDGEKRYGNMTLQDSIRQVGEVFRRSDCVIHAVDIAGLRLDPETTSVDQPAENSLFELAQPTGGEVFRNSNDFRQHFSRMMASTSLVYVLSFRPEATGREGKFHALKVKTKVPGGRVLARAGYYEKTAFRMLSPLERSLVASDVLANEIPVSEIPARLLASPIPDAKGGPARVPVLVEVLGPELLARQAGPSLSAEFYIYAHDSGGKLVDYLTQTVHVDLAKHRDRVEKGGLRYYGELTLPGGDYRVRALVRNGESGRMGLAAESIHVPDFSEKLPYLAPPLFLESSAEGIFVRGRAGEAGPTRGERAEGVPIAGGGMVPAALPEVHAGSPSQISVVAYYFGESAPASLKIGAQVLSQEGRPLGEGAIRVLGQSPAEADGKQIVMVSFTPNELVPGRYALRVFLQDSVTGKAGHASSPFLVR